jgi:predicted porin
MKKTLLAAAALLAVSGAAMAQSAVTLYGVVDASIENVKGTKSLTRVSSDNYATSRFGVKGVEDLGDGLKANFVLEHNVKVDTGAQGNAPRFWDRAAWVGLAGGFGELRLGRIDSSIGLLAGNSANMGAQAYDDLKIAKTFAGDGYRRVDNSITYYIPAVVAGLSAQVQYSTAARGFNSTTGVYDSTVAGNETDGIDSGKGFGLNVQYAAGPFGAGLGYINSKANKDGSVKDTGVLVYGSYDFGAAKLIGYYDVDSTTGKAEDLSVLGFKVNVPVSKDFSLSAGLSKVKNATKNANKDDDATILALRANYSLSKRTSVYGLLTTVDNGKDAALGIDSSNVAIAAGQNGHGIAFGIRHSF